MAAAVETEEVEAEGPAAGWDHRSVVALLEEGVPTGTGASCCDYCSCSAGAGRTVAAAVAGTVGQRGPGACTELAEQRVQVRPAERMAADTCPPEVDTDCMQAVEAAAAVGLREEEAGSAAVQVVAAVAASVGSHNRNLRKAQTAPVAA